MRRLSACLAMTGILLASGLAPAAAQERGGTLSAIIQPEPAVLMVGLNQNGPTQTVAGKIYQGLLTYDFELRPQPGLAKSWTMSEDGLTYTFKLQEGVRWHDGKPFTSADVIFSCMEFLTETHPRARLTFSQVREASAPDPLTVVFHLKQPFAPFLGAFEMGSAPMIPKHIYAGTDFRANPANSTPIGTGPFKFAEWRRGEFIRLVRNDDYWKPGLPYLDQIVFRVVPDGASRRIAIENDEVQLSSFGDVEWFDIPTLKKNPKLDFTDKGYEFFSPLAWMEINHRVAPFDDKRFRQALLYALDRNLIRDRLFFGQGKVATGPVSSTTRFYSDDVKRYDFDPRKANELLDQMNLSRKKDGKRVSIKLLVMPYGESWTRLGEYARQAWEKVGIETTLETTDAGAWGQRVADWDYQITFDYAFQYGDPALGVSRTYLSSNIKRGVMLNNTMGYVNPKVDALFNEAATASSDEKRSVLYKEVQQLVVEDVPVLWLLEMKFPTFTGKKVKGVVSTAIGVNDSFESVYIAK